MTEVEIRFIFANFDGKSVTLKAAMSTLVQDLKRALLESWPTGKVCHYACCRKKLHF